MLGYAIKALTIRTRSSLDVVLSEPMPLVSYTGAEYHPLPTVLSRNGTGFVLIK